MPRELSNEPCELTFDDRISGDKITLYYRLPTTEERVKYTNGVVTRRGNKIVATFGEIRMKAGSAILLGFKPTDEKGVGGFKIPGKGLISSKPGDPTYDPGWKTAIRTFASDVIEMLALQVFETPSTRIEKPVVPELEILLPTEEEWPDSPGSAPAEKEEVWEDPPFRTAPKAKAEDKETNPL